MTRRLITIAIFVMAGVLVNFAVAWGCSSFARIGNQASTTATAADEAWFKANAPFPLTEDWQVVDEVVTANGFGKSIRIVAADDGDFEGARAYRHTLGWPLASLRFAGFSHMRRQDDGSRTWTSAEHRVGRIRLPWASAASPFSRADILCAGLAVNSLLYAAILWLLIRGPSPLRRFIRSKRGLCTACGYPLRESPVCTECGKRRPNAAVA